MLFLSSLRLSEHKQIFRFGKIGENGFSNPGLILFNKELRDSILDLHLTWILVAVSSLCLCPMALATKMRECFVPRVH